MAALASHVTRAMLRGMKERGTISNKLYPLTPVHPTHLIIQKYLLICLINIKTPPLPHKPSAVLKAGENDEQDRHSPSLPGT